MKSLKIIAKTEKGAIELNKVFDWSKKELSHGGNLLMFKSLGYELKISIEPPITLTLVIRGYLSNIIKKEHLEQHIVTEMENHQLKKDIDYSIEEVK